MATKTRRLAMAIRKDHKNKESKFTPTVEEVIHWSEILNHEVFDNRVPKVDGITIREMKKWAYCDAKQYVDEVAAGKRQIELHVSRKFESLTHFLNVLGHELIHAIEYHETGEMDHGKFFWSWSPQFDRHGLKLSKEY